jgi:hypothetical protein
MPNQVRSRWRQTWRAELVSLLAMWGTQYRKASILHEAMAGSSAKQTSLDQQTRSAAVIVTSSQLLFSAIVSQGELLSPQALD